MYQHFAADSAEMSLPIYQTTQCYIPQTVIEMSLVENSVAWKVSQLGSK